MKLQTCGKKPLTGFHLKVIALVCMVLDHAGASLTNDFMPLRCVGRIAFPLYAFLLAEGCRHTRDRTRYLLALGGFALISEIPYDIAFSGSIFPANVPRPLFDYLNFTNVFYTLFFAVACIQIYETLKRQRRRTQVLAAFSCALSMIGIAAAVLFITGDSNTILLLLLALTLCLLLVCGRLPKSEPALPAGYPGFWRFSRPSRFSFWQSASAATTGRSACC